MCNLYSHTKARDAVRRTFAVSRDSVGNLEPQPAIFPDQLAPVVRVGIDGERELLRMRWGFPSPQPGGRPVTNIRNAGSPFWRAWLKPAQRCLVPASSFCEYTDATPKVAHWFALGEDRPLFAFAGVWRPWRGARGPAKDRVEGEHLLFSFLTTEANDVVGPVHAKAMPVLLVAPEDWERWLTAPVEDALALQRPLAGEALRVVATGPRSDG